MNDPNNDNDDDGFDEEDLVNLLSDVLLNTDEEEIDGLEDLIPYIAGLVLTQLQESESDNENEVLNEEQTNIILEEGMIPFLESVDLPMDRIQKAKEAIVERIFNGKNRNKSSDAAVATSATTTTSATSTTTTTKLSQDRIVNMSSALQGNNNTLNFEDMQETENESMWAKGTQVKANANTEMDAFYSNTSAKDKRKARQDIGKTRRAFEAQQEATAAMGETETETKSGVSAMLLPTSQGKDMDVLLLNISLHLNSGQCLLEKGDLKFVYQRRYAIIGENGVGKTTLLNRIANWKELDGFPQHLRVLHVKQELHTENEEMIVLDAVLEADIERTMLLEREKELTFKLEGTGGTTTSVPTDINETKDESSSSNNNNESSNATTTNTTSNVDNTQFTQDMKELKDVYDRLQLLGADTAQSRASAILSGLQFTDDMQHMSIKSLSGGWRMRVALAAALLIEPDILMLDEPTNHLDLEAVLWLEAHLQQYPHTIIAVSHDRGFLNEVCTDTIEFKHKILTYYRGNYDTFVRLKNEKTKNAIREYQAYKSKREHMMEFITKFRANAKRATMVQSRIKTVEKMDLEAPPLAVADTVWRFSIPSSEPLGRPIIAINDVTFDYLPGEKLPIQYLLQKVNFGVDNSSKIAILGANGQGKTTLLNLIMGHIRPISGSCIVNSGLRIGHFTQHHSERFDLNLSAIENMLEIFSTETRTEDDQVIRSFLGKFQIQGVDAVKPMRFLSGGQKSRVSFAVLAYQKPHLLIIDEGSNHLSMDAVDALIESIQQFKGGLLVVSHDQYFVSKTCNELWVVDNGIATRFEGTFDDYKAYTAKKTKKRVEESVKKMANLNH